MDAERQPDPLHSCQARAGETVLPALQDYTLTLSPSPISQRLACALSRCHHCVSVPPTPTPTPPFQWLDSHSIPNTAFQSKAFSAIASVAISSFTMERLHLLLWRSVDDKAGQKKKDFFFFVSSVLYWTYCVCAHACVQECVPQLCCCF